MKILIAGGLGFEDQMLSALKDYPITLIGNSYDLKMEKFNPLLQNSTEHIHEYITHNYSQFLLGNQILIDISESLKSKFILNDFGVKNSQRTLFLYYYNGWKIFAGYPDSGCLSCLLSYEKPAPPASYPPVPVDLIISEIISIVNTPVSKSFLLNLETLQKDFIDVSANCLPHKGNYLFMDGELSDVVSVSCGDKSVAITPMNEIKVDLKEYKELIKNWAIITRETQFFLEFSVENLSVLLFKQGRIVVKGTKEKNTALFLYRKFIGN